ncbi:hypothetical protein CH302_00935 [Rhodococcus sp. 15-2388-1-1a]|uniref:hypothetical protein n=1 Tax=Nocardiaceae TaxID=85025 RepID=UPI000562756D|nr:MULTISPECIES: hypothetical protein [Rhodococcus]OZF05220.1 hypothetical protein CH302_00935 [Rhodococcus sp. 15-2388-1-1a]
MTASPNPKWNSPEMADLRRAGLAREKAARIEAYREMRSAGMSHKRIAEIQGVRFDSLMRWLNRNGVYIPEPLERATYRRLDELIASGQEFTARDLPDDAPRSSHTAAVLRAWHNGRIERVGTVMCRYGGGGKRIYVYRATAQEDSQCLRTA